MQTRPDFEIRPATVDDVPTLLNFIKELAAYERLSHEVVTDEQRLRESLFGETPAAEVLLGFFEDEPVCFAVYFTTFSTFLGRPGIYLEDVYVKPAFRGRGFGRTVLVYLARLAKARNCGRFEWAVLDWNTPAIEFYEKLGAVPLNEWTTYRVTGQALDRLAEG